MLLTRHPLGRAALATGLAACVVFVVSPVSPASALGSSASPITAPASVIASIIGDVLPSDGAAEAAGMTLSTGGSGESGALSMLAAVQPCSDAQAAGTYSGSCTVYAAKNFVKSVPGFELGFKIGGYIDDATGLLLGSGDQSQPDPNFVPYADLPAAVTDGWPAGTFPVSAEFPGDGGGTGIYVSVDDSVWTYGGNPTWSNAYGTGSAGIKIGGNVTPESGRNPLRVNLNGYCHRLDDPTALSTNPFTIEAGNPTSNGINTSGTYTYNVFDPNDENGALCAPGYGFDHFVVGLVSTFGNSIPGLDGTVPVVWNPAGSPARSGAGSTSGTPDRTWITTATCLAPGGTRISITGISPKFKEDATSFPAYPIAQCPDGDVPIGSRIDLGDDTGTHPVKTVTALNSPSQWTDWLTANPNCWNGGCPVLLEQLMPDGTWQSCFDNEVGCEHWFTDPDKASKFRCTQNGNVLALSDCNFYSPTFDPVEKGKGVVYANPKDGVAAAPSTTPATNPTVTNPVPDHTPTAGGGSSSSSSCFPSGWSAFNPVEWVLQPIECAFIPSPSAAAAVFTGMRNRFNGTALGAWMHGIGGVFSGLTSGHGGCKGPPITWNGFTQAHLPATIYPFDGCYYPEKYAADASNLVLTAGLGFFGGLRCVQALAAGFGWRIHIAPYIQGGA